MNYQHIVGGTAALLIAAMFFAPLVGLTYRRFRKHGFAFVLIAAGFLYSMATKPEVTWDDYISNNGSKWITNAQGVVTGVYLGWRKTREDLPGDQNLFISYRLLGSSGEWELLDTTKVKAYSWDRMMDDATNYAYWVWHNWEPPSPVHTNGVWLGNVIERAKGARGAEKMVIIKGQLMKDGKVIAP